MQFELTYSNILTMLDLGGIPLRSADRGEAHPLILGGGPTATHPEPVAPFFDAFVIGDGEEKATEVALTWTRLRREGVPRRERLVALARLGAVYVPQLHATRVDADTGLVVVDRPLEAGVPFPTERSLVDLDQYPLPRRRADRRPRGHLRPPVDRDRPRLHRGVPLLPGGDDLPARTRARPRADRRYRAPRGEEVRPGRGVPHRALHGGRLLHRTPGQEGGAPPRRGADLAGRLLAARLRPRAGAARRAQAGARHRPHLRPRGGDAADARRGQQERHRGAAPGDGRARLLPRVGQDEALLHDRPPHRDRRRRPRRGRDRHPHRGRGPAGRPRPRGRGDGERVHPRPQAAHPLPVGGDGFALRGRPEAAAPPRPRPRAQGDEAQDPRGQRLRARGHLRPRRPPPRRRPGARVEARGPLRLLGRPAPPRPLGGGVHPPRHRPRPLPGHPAALGAPPLEPHRRRPGRRLPRPRVPEGPPEPSQPPLRQGRRRLHPPRQPGGRPRRPAPAGLLRLRRRLRPHPHAGRAHHLPREARRREAQPAPPAPDAGQPRARRHDGEEHRARCHDGRGHRARRHDGRHPRAPRAAAPPGDAGGPGQGRLPLPVPLREDGHRRPARPPRSGPRAPPGCSAGWGSPWSTPRGSTPSPT